MKSPCVDCAYRTGSPFEHDPRLPRNIDSAPFFCHHGMSQDGEKEYLCAATANGLPLGYFVCAGWWQTAVEGRELNATEYRDSRTAVRPTDRSEPDPATTSS